MQTSLHFKMRIPAVLRPHHQGLIESAVKPAKLSLYEVKEDRVLTFEEYNTLFYHIEAALNSKPLCTSGDGYLTPGIFSQADICYCPVNAAISRLI